MNSQEKFLTALVGPVQTLEDTLTAVLYGRMLDNAIGVQLDAIGKIVGRPRDGITDDDTYRRYVRAQISANKSDGLISDLITIADLVVDDDAATYVVANTGRASLVLRVEGVTTSHSVAAVLIDLLRQSKAGGVRLLLVYYPFDPSLAFAFAGSSDGAGWGSVTDAALGGKFANVLE